MKAQQWSSQQGQNYFNDLNKTEQIFGDPAMPVFAKPAAGVKTTATPTGGNTGPTGVSPGQF